MPSLLPIARFSGHKGSIYAIEPLSDSTFLTAGSEGLIVQWDINTPEEGILLARVPTVVFSMLKYGGQLLAGTSHGTIHVINLVKRKEVRVLQYHTSAVYRIAFWNQQQKLFSLDGKGNIQVYDQELNPVTELHVSEGKLRSIAFSDNEFVVGTSEGKILRFNSDFHLLNEYQPHQENFGVNALYFSGGKLISGSRDARLIISVPESGKILENIPAHNYAVYDIALRPDSNDVLATASRDKTVKLWSYPSLEPLQRLDAEKQGHLNSVNDIAWLSRNILVSAGDDRSAIAWKFQD